VHTLFLLSNKTSIADVIKQVKGATSHYINSTDLISEKFSWQTEYASYSVSESIQETVYQYIKRQKLHHLKKSFHSEYNDFIKLHAASET
jgi:REP element-mobilizing transposase RayT